MPHRFKPVRQRLSRTLLKASRRRAKRHRDPAETITVAELIEGLGDKSFGWGLLIFSLVNLLPLPFGSNMVTSLPVIWLAGQMALGYGYVHLPGVVMRRRIKRRSFRRVVLRFRPVIAPIERAVRPRLTGYLTRRHERVLGAVLLAVSLALFMPIPFSGILPAFSIFVAAFGLVERDGVVTYAGAALGLVAIGITVAMTLVLILGLKSIHILDYVPFLH